MKDVTIISYLVLSYRLTFLIGLGAVAIAKFRLPGFLQYGKTLQRPKVKNGLQIIYTTVPKAWFAHFYYLSTTLSLINVYFYFKSPIVWPVAFHSIRRLYETKVICQYTPSSRMNWSHYVVGIWFYSVLNIIISLKHYERKVPYSWNTLSLLVFSLASWDQHKNHRTLSKLVKYSLPTDGLFQWVCCPHYFDEILIYASLATYNMEFCWLLLWAFVNLSVSALENRKYYLQKFPEAQVPRYAIVPLVL